MSFSEIAFPCNPNSPVALASQLVAEVIAAAKQGKSFLFVESLCQHLSLKIAKSGVDLFLANQGVGDLGDAVEHDGVSLVRSDEPRPRPVRTIFGEHSYSAYVYGRCLHDKIDFRPIDVRMQLPKGVYSPLLVQYAQMMTVEMSHDYLAFAFQTMFGQNFSVHSLERMNLKVGEQAEQFVYEMPIPKPAEEGKILVVSGDGKGVPMKRDQTKTPLPFDKREYAGNCKMAVAATVYSVDPLPRTAQEFVEALFRENPDPIRWKRPEPVGKMVVACLSEVDANGEVMPGEVKAFTWAAEQVARRRQPGQVVVRVMDGQPSLWDTSSICLGGLATIDVLDIIHVSSYVWTASKAFYENRSEQEAYTKECLIRILEGGVGGVISGMRQKATKQGLPAKSRAAVEKACRYFQNNRARMKYDAYLSAGYPIASGVIEGACRHLVMDRMCRTGMRWSTKGAQAMLHVRAVHQAGQEKAFHAYQAQIELDKTRKYRELLNGYQPLCA